MPEEKEQEKEETKETTKNVDPNAKLIKLDDNGGTEPREFIHHKENGGGF